tara:strand:+ start:268 stop:1008 length:741 start_codon:yes stop_codon:yes gene_type:complete
MAETRQATLTGRKLFIGIPAYDGKLNIKTAFALAQLMPKAMSLGVAVSLSDLSNCSIITMARNALVHEFLKTDCTEMLFIDSDVIVTPDDILRLMAQSGDKDITTGVYPRRAKDAKFFADVYYDDNGDLEFEGSLMRVRRAPTGFMLIQRHVIERLIEAHPEWTYEKCPGEKMSAVFDFAVVNGKYVGEDYLFCDRATQMGFTVYIDVDISLPHVGQEKFERNFREEVVMPMLEDMYRHKLKVVNG